jgi:hypothetical protein
VIAGEFGPTPDAARTAAMAECAIAISPSSLCRVIHIFNRKCSYIASGLDPTAKKGGWAIAANKAAAIAKVSSHGFASNIKGVGGCVGGQGLMEEW